MGLDGLELILDIQTTFDIQIPDDDSEQMVTIGDTRDYVVAHVDPAVWPRERVEEKVLDLVAQQFMVPRATLRWDTNYARDLNA